MRFEEPGRKLLQSSIIDILDSQANIPSNFLDVGCGAGSLSQFLIKMGMMGSGVEISSQAYEQCQQMLVDEIRLGTFKLHDRLDNCVEKFDLVICINVLEHILDDRLFLDLILRNLVPGGLLIIGVPGREDRWYLEDDLVGHLRRYSKNRLQTLIEEQTNSKTEIWSIGYPLMNIGQRVKNILLKKQASQFSGLSKEAQTQTSGIRSVPLLPIWSILGYVSNFAVKLLFSPIQRLFYNSNAGIQLIAFARSRANDNGAQT